MRLISRKTLLLFFLPGAVFMGAFLIYPIITMVIDSFYEIGITGSKRFIGPDNYIRAFTAGGFLKQLMNTLIYITVAVGVETVAGLLFALFFELDYRGSKIIRSFMMAPLMIAPLVAGLTWKLMMSSSFGIVNELLTRVGILESPSGILWLADEKWSLLYCRYMADNSFYDADDTGRAAGTGHQHAGSCQNRWGGPAPAGIFHQAPGHQTGFADCPVRKDH